MTLATLYEKLNSITELKDKVRYRAFEPGTLPAPPYCCYLVTDSQNFIADNKIYNAGDAVDIELYTSSRDFVLEGKIETALADLELPWVRSDSYETSEEVYLIIYSTTIRR